VARFLPKYAGRGLKPAQDRLPGSCPNGLTGLGNDVFTFFGETGGRKQFSSPKEAQCVRL
jgi:hypothetical protein